MASRIFTENLLRAHARQTSKLVDLVPVYEFTYPSGVEHFESTRKFLLEAHR